MPDLGISSVRFRLTLWYVGLLCVILIAFSAGLYALLAQSAYGNLDRELAASIDILERSLRHEIQEHNGNPAGEQQFAGVVRTVYRDAFPGIALAVYEGSREVAAKPGPFGLVPEAPKAASTNLRFADYQEDGEPWRRAILAVSIPMEGDYEFVACASTEGVESGLVNLRRILFFSVPLALLFAAVGGFLLAKRSLAPVVVMSDTAAQISSKDLSQRIPVQNAKDELGRLASTFNQLLGRLETSFSQQRQFMADSSHELRTPIYVAHTAAQVILDRQERPEQEYREALAAIDEQLVRINRIVEDMLVLARADAGVYPIEIEDFYLDETIAECLRAARLLGQQAGVSVTAGKLDELPCRGDEGMIRQLVMILLDNAVKYTPTGGKVNLEVKAIRHDAKPAYQIDVSDTGPGIPAEAQPHVFERFFRADQSRTRRSERRGSGAGLGLAIAQWIAGVHGGMIEIAQTSPSGTVFRVVILRESGKPPAAGNLRTDARPRAGTPPTVNA